MRARRLRSLTGQTLLVLLLALVVSHAIGIGIYAYDRKKAITYTEAHDLADRVTGMVNLLHQLPARWRPEIVRQSDGRTLHVMLSSAPDAVGQDLDPDLSNEVARYLRSQFPDKPDRRIMVGLSDSPYFAKEKILRSQSILMPQTRLDIRDPQQAYYYLHISIELGDEEWLNLSGAIPRVELFQIGPAATYILIIAVVVGGVAVWLVFRVTKPLADFAQAAERLGMDLRAEPLPETGPTEVVEAAHAFNAMQERLQRLIHNRTQMLAAISHDLRTPVTLLRLRAEAIADSAERAKLLHTLDEMETMMASVLEFTKATSQDEPQRQVDLSALVASICDDMADAGAAITFRPAPKIPFACRRVSLKRALTNVIANAVQYGNNAWVSIEQRPDGPEIVVEDDGPGIPIEQHEHVFMPFHRVDSARSPDAGGVGLGLSIAQTIVHGHGGRIALANRPQGGLRVRVVLPAEQTDA